MAQVLPESNSLSLEASLGIGIAVTVLAGLCVAVRIKTNWRSSIINHIGDAISVVALAFIAGTVAGQWKIITKTSDPNTPLNELIQLNYAVVWVGSIAMWSSKVPLLLLYVQLFGIKTWVKIVSYIIIGATATIFIIFAALTTARCNPGDGALDVPFILACVKQASDSGFALGLTSVLTDVIIFLIPIPLILRLNLSTRKKIGLSIVFSSGLVAIAVSATSANYKRKSQAGDSDGTTGSMICTIVECAVALMVGCVPALYNFWSHTITTSPFYTRISSLSQRSLLRLRTSNASASTEKIHSKPTVDGSKGNDNNSQKLDIHHVQHTSIPPIPQSEPQYMSHHSQRDIV